MREICTLSQIRLRIIKSQNLVHTDHCNLQTGDTTLLHCLKMQQKVFGSCKHGIHRYHRISINVLSSQNQTLSKYCTHEGNY